MTFVTPSGLSRHKYVHTAPRYSCTDCTESFHFESQLKQHRVKDLKVKSYFCNFGSCTHGFMNKPDLLKHVWTHKGPEIKCPSCDYTMKDKRLYTSHQKCHTDKLHFCCNNCGKEFRYHNQLRQHMNDPKKCILIRIPSESPEF